MRLKIICLVVLLLGCTTQKEEGINREKRVEFESVKLNEIVSISEFGDGDFFGSISKSVVLENGHIVIADTRQNHLVELDRDLNYIRILGREGRGPGDFSRIHSITSSGNSVWVFDGVNQKVTEYRDKDGSLKLQKVQDLRFTPITGQPMAFFIDFIFGDEGKNAAVYYDFQNLSQEEFKYHKVMLIPYKDSFTPVSDSSSLILDTSPELMYERNVLSIPHYERGLYTTTSEYFVYAINTKSIITFYDIEGEIEKEIKLPEIQKKLTSVDKENAFDQMYARHPDPSGFKAKVVSMIPDQQSFLAELKSDSEDRIWVRLYAEDGEDDWLVFDKEGNPVLKTKLPEGEYFLNAKSQNIYTRRNSENGPEVVLYSWE